jgi:hypothetical protein
MTPHKGVETAAGAAAELHPISSPLCDLIAHLPFRHPEIAAGGAAYAQGARGEHPNRQGIKGPLRTLTGCATIPHASIT